MRQELLTQLADNTNSPEFRIVTINYIEKQIIKGKDAAELESFDEKLREIAKNHSLSLPLRAYAAGYSGLTTDHNQNKNTIREILNDPDPPIVNGISKTVKKYLRSGFSESENEYWAKELINVLENNYERIEEYDAVISTLAYARNEVARDYLLNLFNTNALTNPNLSKKIAASMEILNDKKALTAVFNTFHDNDIFQDYGSELLLMSFAKENREIVKELGKSVRKDEQLAFLMSARLDRSEEKSQYLNDIMKLLDSKSTEIRKEAIRTLHYLLPNDEEKKIFFRHLENEGSAEVINTVYFYVGRPN